MAEKMEISYQRKGDYLFPDLMIEETPLTYGKYGMLRKNYLKENRRNWYRSMDLAGKLADHLRETDRKASERMDQITEQMAVQEKVTEALKSQDMMEWIRRMNSIRNRAEEIVLAELVYN